MLSRAALCALALPLVTACAAARTTAAAPPGSPTAFDPTKSDAKAIEVADQVLAAVGGPAWASAKELRWTTEIYDGDKVVLHAEQAWDRWNGRAYLKQVPQAEGASPTIAMYELYGDTEAAIVEKPGSGMKERANAENAREIIAKAKERFAQDQYWVTMHLRLKDPGVHLKFVEERPAEGSTTNEPKYDVIQLAFDPGVGPPAGPTYFLIIDKATHLPDSVEMSEMKDGQERRIGYKYLDWTDVGGVKFATTRQNIGLASEKLTFANVKVSTSPDEDLYTPPVGIQ